ncbi:hypothetical protein [Jannaschia pohangensis]|uniref:hypothetical protein n=1 Tax=Jannaschia pohangensis TaxID=390807 RepID=UPI001114594C|nr:hypothetical protein [Jannaschia pohangensis]
MHRNPDMAATGYDVFAGGGAAEGGRAQAMDDGIGVGEQRLQRAGHRLAVLGTEAVYGREVLGEDGAIFISAEAGRAVVFEKFHHDPELLARNTLGKNGIALQQDD